MNNTVAKTLTGAQILLDTLKNSGVDTIFGYPGGIVLSVYDELLNRSDIKHVLVRHEQAAVHAAEGYARTSGKCGVVLVTSGPGGTNTVTGLMDAYLDGIPVIVITGQVVSDMLGRDAFQEADICSMTKSCTKANFQVKSIDALEDTIVSAFQIAQSGKKGPVLVDITKDVFSSKSAYLYRKPVVNSSDTFEGDYNLALAEILSAKKPVIVAGGGVLQADASDELCKFAQMLNIPVVSTMMGLGAYPQGDKNYLGMLGIFGDFSANQALRESDLVLSIGARFNDRITCCFDKEQLSKKFIQLDINKKELSRNVAAHIELCGDAKLILSKMLSSAKQQAREAWINEARLLKSKNAPRKKISEKLHAFEVIRAIDKFTLDKDVVFTAEVGQHQVLAAQNLTLSRNRKLFSSCGAGTMGFGFPAAIGASFACDSPVVCIAGDGSFQMNIQELATCADYDLPVKIMVINNGYLGMVRQLQDKFCDGRYSETKISNPDFVKLAQSYGLPAMRVNSYDEINSALEFAFNTKGTVIVDFVVEPLESV